MSTHIKRGVYSYLTGQTAFTNTVGTRLFPNSAEGQAPQTPYITYQRINSDPEHDMSGASGLASVTFQFDCYGSTSDEADQAAEALRAELQGFQRGTMGSVSVRSVFKESDNDFFIEPQDGGEGTGLHRTSSDYTFWYVEDVPTFS